jgi:hypothetical protein
MAAKNKVTVSVQPTKQRLSSAERRAAQIATFSTNQAEPQRHPCRVNRQSQGAATLADRPTTSRGKFNADCEFRRFAGGRY